MPDAVPVNANHASAYGVQISSATVAAGTTIDFEAVTANGAGVRRVYIRGNGGGGVIRVKVYTNSGAPAAPSSSSAATTNADEYTAPIDRGLWIDISGADSTDLITGIGLIGSSVNTIVQAWQ